MINKRLLILDDDAAIGQTIGYIAEAIGMEIRATTSASEFFDELDRWQPGHIALDLIMPDMDGVEVMVELARRDCRARIIITSGVGSRVLDAAGRSAVEHGLDIAGVLSKPFSPSRLKELLSKDAAPGRPDRSRGTRPDGDDISVDEFAHALENRELELAFQPKVYCASGMLAGFEALVRWRSPTRGLVMPGSFIPLAESNDLITPLTEQVIDLSLNWFSTGFDGAKPDLTLSINLSARTLDVSSFVDQVSSHCVSLGVSPKQVIFELTETSAMADPVASLDLLTRLRMKGFQLSIDDFGTGYSSMLQLVRLPFSEIKVDRSFVMTAAKSEESRAVIRSIVELGQSLSLRTTAEGVEDDQTLNYLKLIGCELAQGYYIARPLSGEDALAWARQNQS
jgi:EAL domain-containing protein (putative c-di-GMP-specific phosphodiesterase class I)/ActR/RegA family two-component response regulator